MFQLTVIGCLGGRFHSVVWSESEFLVAGLNAGQLGLGKEDGAIINTAKVHQGLALE